MLQLNEAVDRFTKEVLPSKDKLLSALRSRKLTIYHGVDPTGPDLHIGHSTNYLLLRAFQDAGHKVILLIGDFTARIGDPSDKTAVRRRLGEKEIRQNLKTYKDQVGKILEFTGPNPAEIKFNATWLSKLTFKDIIELAAEFTVQRIIERDIFQKRLAENKPLYLHEFFYPLAQGYDSVAMEVDAEVGGTDQTFNMLVGRTLVGNHLNKEKFVISTPLLVNPVTGAKLMSKSEGNYIALNDSPETMFGKVMALPDETVIQCFLLCTTLPQEEIDKIRKEHPMEAKKRLGIELVTMYHSAEDAKGAAGEFEATFQKGEIPSTIPTYKEKGDKINLPEVLTATGMAVSRSEVKRLIEQGAIEWNGKRVDGGEIEVGRGGVLKVGKYRFLRVTR